MWNSVDRGDTGNSSSRLSCVEDGEIREAARFRGTGCRACGNESRLKVVAVGDNGGGESEREPGADRSGMLKVEVAGERMEGRSFNPRRGFGIKWKLFKVWGPLVGTPRDCSSPNSFCGSCLEKFGIGIGIG